MFINQPYYHFMTQRDGLDLLYDPSSYYRQ